MAKKPPGFSVGNVQYGRFSGVNSRRAANENATVRERVNKLKSLTAETDRMLKADKSYKLTSGSAAYGPKPSAGPSMGAKIAGTVARGALRAAGPVGALVGMTKPAGAPKGHPAYEASTVRKTGSYGPLMKGNSKPSGKISVPGGRGVTAFGGSSKPPKSTGGKMAVPGGRGVTAITFGGSSKDQSRVPASRSGGFMGPSKTTSKSSGGTRSGPGATGGSKTAGRSTSSKSNLGTSRF